MNAGSKRWLGFGMIVAAGLLIPHLALKLHWLQLAELKAYDFHMQSLPPRVPEEIVLLAIDQASIERYSEPLFLWHRYYAEAIEGLSRLGAKAIGVDIAFAIPVEKWAPGHDAALAQAFLDANASSRVVCGTAAPLSTTQRHWPVPWNMLCAAYKAGGFVNLRADEDDFIRTFEVWDALGDQPSFAWAAARAFNSGLARPPARILRIRHAGPAGTIRRISLAAFLDALASDGARQMRPLIEGKAVLLGPDLLTDRHATPYYAFRAGSPANTSGVEIHGSAIATLLRGDYLTDLPAPFPAAGVLLIAMALAGAAVFSTPRLLAVAAVLAPVAAVLGAHWLLRLGWVAPTVLWLMAWLAALLSGLAVRSVIAERHGVLFRRAAALFIGEGAAGQMERTGSLQLEPRQHMVTVLFTDIEGFTAFSDTREPAEVLTGLNRYFEQVTAIVVRHGGQVNKLIGDGMLALFSDQDSAPQPPELRGVLAAREIVFATTGFRTRAGVHTGWAVVGNVGSGDKLEYTALGDTVNVASRLEALNKERDTRLLVSGVTRERIGNSIAFVPVGEVAVRGKSAGLPIYTIEWPQE